MPIPEAKPTIPEESKSKPTIPVKSSPEKRKSKKRKRGYKAFLKAAMKPKRTIEEKRKEQEQQLLSNKCPTKKMNKL